MGIPCFLLTETNRIRVWARRYSDSKPDICPLCKGEYSYHNNMNLIGDFEHPRIEGQYEDWCGFLETIRPPVGDPIWPGACKCGASFEDSHVERGGQMFAHRICQRSDNGGFTTLQEAPPGALWWAWWMGKKEDGTWGYDWDNQMEPPLMCRTPSGMDWCIDGRASNCTLKEERTHR